jgi:Domain of unknown function (DUF4440)
MFRSALILAFSLPFTLATTAFALDPNPDHRVKGAEQYHLTEGPITTPEIRQAIMEADREMFDAVFTHCDAARVGSMVTDDVRFIHDKAGQFASSKSELVSMLSEECARQANGTNFRSRRELIPDSLHIYAINQYGAVELGQHRFFALIPGKPEQLTETGEFVILWKQVGDRWLMAETISYDHKLVR